jgi:hypothetical protein
MPFALKACRARGTPGRTLFPRHITPSQSRMSVFRGSIMSFAVDPGKYVTEFSARAELAKSLKRRCTGRPCALTDNEAWQDTDISKHCDELLRPAGARSRANSLCRSCAAAADSKV